MSGPEQIQLQFDQCGVGFAQNDFVTALSIVRDELEFVL